MIRHGGDQVRVELPPELPDSDVEASLDGFALAEALARLETLDANLADLVSLHYLVGYTVAESAEALDISEAKAKKDLQFARRWLAQHAAR